MTSNHYSKHDTRSVKISDILEGDSDKPYKNIKTHAEGPKGKVPFTEDFLINRTKRKSFWNDAKRRNGLESIELLRKQFMILSTSGGIRNEDGETLALGLHTGHFELRDMVIAAANELKNLKSVPFAAFCSDPCDGRTQGTTGMLDSLPYRNDAAQVFRRIARSLPTVRG